MATVRISACVRAASRLRKFDDLAWALDRGGIDFSVNCRQRVCRRLVNKADACHVFCETNRKGDAHLSKAKRGTVSPRVCCRLDQPVWVQHNRTGVTHQTAVIGKPFHVMPCVFERLHKTGIKPLFQLQRRGISAPCFPQKPARCCDRRLQITAKLHVARENRRLCSAVALPRPSCRKPSRGHRPKPPSRG